MNSSYPSAAMKTVSLAISICLIGFVRDAIAGPYQASIGTTVDTYLSSIQSPIAGNGGIFFAQGTQWNVDPRLVVAISGQEQNFGKAPTSCNSVYNAWSWFYNGLRCPQAAFSSWAEGIQTVTKYLRVSYFDRYHATTIPAIGRIYCTEACGDWAANVTTFYSDHLGGNSGDLTFAQPANQTFVHQGREWRKINDVIGFFSWNQIAAVCNPTTGACAGNLGGKSVTGWTWASIDEVFQMIEGVSGLPVGALADRNENPAADTIFATNAIGTIGAISGDANQSSFIGMTRSTHIVGSETYGSMPYVIDNAPMFSDNRDHFQWAGQRIDLDSGELTLGVYLYRASP